VLFSLGPEFHDALVFEFGVRIDDVLRWVAQAVRHVIVQYTSGLKRAQAAVADIGLTVMLRPTCH